MEFPAPTEVPAALDKLLNCHREAELFVLSEYTFDGPVPERVKAWCRKQRKYLIAGGKDIIGAAEFFNTAFVVGPDGEIVFRQVKSVPIQFFKDGRPALEQRLWESPWGKLGLCVCYDLSYRRVTDQLIRLGAQAIIAPTMDVADWGGHQHRLHARVAPVRAAEYGVPIFRVCSSGISQLIDREGRVVASAAFPGEHATIAGSLELAERGRLPLDRWLAPLSVFVTAGTVLWLSGKALLSKFSKL
jgi:apolipoprotein N-acyltransferase